MFMGYGYISYLGIFTEIAALLFAGFWLVDEYQPEEISNSFTFSPEAIDPNAEAQATRIALSGADKLMTYKKLLDDGIITQEEFEEKKKQIMDLYF